MREVLADDVPTLEVLPELAAGCLGPVETDGLSILIELFVYDLEPEGDRSILIDRLPDEDADGILVLMELPIRALLPGLIRMLELLLTEAEPAEPLLIDEPDEGLRKLEELEGLETVIRRDVEPPGLLEVDIVPERLGVERLIDILLELLRPGIERLDEIELERLGVDRLTDILLELLRLGTDRLGLRLADIVLDRLGVGGRLTDVLLELLRLGTDRLEVIVLDRLGVGSLLKDDLLELLRLGVDRPGLRLADIELDRLGAGARLADDLLELLRLGALALAGGADRAACVLWLELRELELFLDVLAARAGSAARASSKMKQINRKSKACPFDWPRAGSERSRRIVNRNLSLWLSMVVSFLSQSFVKELLLHT